MTLGEVRVRCILPLFAGAMVAGLMRSDVTITWVS